MSVQIPACFPDPTLNISLCRSNERQLIANEVTQASPADFESYLPPQKTDFLSGLINWLV